MRRARYLVGALLIAVTAGVTVLLTGQTPGRTVGVRALLPDIPEGALSGALAAAAAHFDRGRYEQARQAAAELAKSPNASAEVRVAAALVVGQTWYNQRELTRARQAFGRAKQQAAALGQVGAPYYADALFSEANCQRLLGEHEQALAGITDLLREYPTAKIARYAAGPRVLEQLLQATGRPDKELVELLEPLADRYPDSKVGQGALVRLANFYAERELLPTAAAYYTRAARALPQGRAQDNMGKSAERARQRSEAEGPGTVAAHYLRAIRLGLFRAAWDHLSAKQGARFGGETEGEKRADFERRWERAWQGGAILENSVVGPAEVSATAPAGKATVPVTLTFKSDAPPLASSGPFVMKLVRPHERWLVDGVTPRPGATGQERNSQGQQTDTSAMQGDSATAACGCGCGSQKPQDKACAEECCPQKDEAPPEEKEEERAQE